MAIDPTPTPIANEFLVNTVFNGAQSQATIAWLPASASLPDGGFVVVWTSVGPGLTPALPGGSFQDIHAQLYDAAGNPVGVEFRVNTFVSAQQISPAVASLPSSASLPDGGFVVTWSTFTPFGISGQRFDATGAPVGTEFNVQQDFDTDNGRQNSTVTGLDGGGFLVTWTALKQDGPNGVIDGSGAAVLGRIYDATGVAVTDEFLLNTTTANAQNFSSAAALPGGGFVATWVSFNQDGSSDGIFGQRFDAAGAKVGAEFPINAVTAFQQQFPSMTALAGGGFVVTWTSFVDNTVHFEVVGRIFDAAGNPAGAEFRINASTPVSVLDTQNLSSVTALADGGFLVVWQSRQQDGSATFGVFAQRFDATGAKLGTEFQINQTVAGNQGFEEGGGDYTVVQLASGDVMIVWQSGPDASGFTDVYARRFALPALTDDVSVVGSPDIAIDLSALVDVGGSVTVTDNGAAVTIDLSNLASVGGNFTLNNNGAVVIISVPNLTQVDGSVSVNGNTGAATVDLSALTSSGGDVSANGNTGAVTIDLGALTSTGGDVSVNGNTGAATIDLVALTSTGGDVSVNGNTGATTIDLGALTSTGGDVSVNGNTGAVTIDLGALTSTGGDVNVNGNTAAVTIDLGALTSTGGDVSANGNTGAVAIDLGALTSSGGDVSANGNTGAVTIDLGALTSTGGDVSVNGNTGAATIDLGALTSSGGDVNVNGNTDAVTIDLGALDTVAGDVTVEAAPDATAVDASRFGPGGGAIVLTGGSNGDATVTVGALTNMAGTLTITGAGGVTVTAQAGLAEITTTGTAGDDTATGSATATNTMDGGKGNDDLTGGAAADDISGGEGDDKLTAGDGDDTVRGGAGDDTVVGGHGGGDDTYDGGGDIDTVNYTSTTLGIVVDLAAGTASGAEIGSDTLIGIENVVGGNGGDTIGGDGGANVLDGGAGNDTVIFSGRRSDYTIEATGEPDTYRVIDNRIGPNDGIDIVSGFELFQFSDGTLTEADILTVTTLNDAPTVANAIADQNATEDSAFGFTVPANSFADADVGDSLTLTATLADGDALPGWLSFNVATGEFSGTPLNGDVGPITVRVTATDGSLASVFDDFVLNVANTNDAPTANPDTDSAGENETKSFNALANDTDPDVGDSKTLVSIDAVAVLSSNALVNGLIAAGALSIVGGQIQFSPGTLFDPLNTGETATVVVNYTMRDAAGVTASSTLMLTINGAAEGPVYNVINGTSGNDRNLNGTAAADQINGLAGNDWIDAKGGDDLIVAGAGQDLVHAGGGNDTVMATINDGHDLYLGESGSDTFDFSHTSAPATVSLGTTTLGFTLNGVGFATSTQIGTDVLLGFEDAIGGSGNDAITGDNLANILRGGGGGGDTISGLRGVDQLFGDAGNDWLIGGRGSDLMTGGLDADRFVFKAAQSQAGDIDTITDFVVGQDHLEFQGLAVTQLTELDVNGDSVLDTSLTLNDGAVIRLLSVSGVSQWDVLL